MIAPAPVVAPPAANTAPRGAVLAALQLPETDTVRMDNATARNGFLSLLLIAVGVLVLAGLGWRRRAAAANR